MTGSRKKRSTLFVTKKIVTKKIVTKKTPRAPMRMSVALTGDRRLAENLILEVRAVAERYGLEIPSVEIVRQPRVGPKVKLTSGRKSR